MSTEESKNQKAIEPLVDSAIPKIEEPIIIHITVRKGLITDEKETALINAVWEAAWSTIRDKYVEYKEPADGHKHYIRIRPLSEMPDLE